VLGFTHAWSRFHLTKRHREPYRLTGNILDVAGELGVIVTLAHALQKLRLAAHLFAQGRSILG
jgi:hypothetical protein